MSSAVATRERRKTAGQRMTALVGKALEDDNAFWGHGTWDDDGDSGNESFRESDEDSELKKDQFDSDFDDSESDREDEEEAAGMEAEADLKKAERIAKQRKSNYVDIAKAGRDLMQKKKGKGKKRVVGDGVNAGIVLNFPDLSLSAGSQLSRPPQAPNLEPTLKKQTKLKSEITLSPPAANSRRRRSLYSPRKLRETRSTAPSDLLTNTKSANSTKRMKRRRYAQEELLLEAINETEPENERWLLARKRVQDLVEKDKDAALRDLAAGKIVEKYNSRRGCLNTLTFPEMDAVPEILTRQKMVLTKPSATTCAITGKRARYRDPVTKLGYYDVASFKEIRRLHEAGEPIIPVSESRLEISPMEVAVATLALESSEKHSVSSGLASSNGMKTNPALAPPINRDLSLELTGIRSNGRAEVEVGCQTPPPSSEAGKKSEGTASGSPIRSASLAVKHETTEKPPLSPGRRSRRRWKPSSKLLQNIANEDRNQAAAAGALTIRTETDGMEWCRSSASGNEHKDTVSGSERGNGHSSSDTHFPSSAPIVNGSMQQVEAAANDTKPGACKRYEEPSVSMNTQTPNCDATKAQTNEAEEQLSPSDDNEGTKRCNKMEEATGNQRPEPVYFVPKEAEVFEAQKGGNGERQYITQSELIMEAIQTYSRQRERSLSQSDH